MLLRQGGILSYSESVARGPRLALLLSLLSPGRDGATAAAAGWGPGRDSDDFLWQLMANYGDFQVDLFGDYLDRRTDCR
jgi:hypothetical protein